MEKGEDLGEGLKWGFIVADLWGHVGHGGDLWGWGMFGGAADCSPLQTVAFAVVACHRQECARVEEDIQDEIQKLAPLLPLARPFLVSSFSTNSVPGPLPAPSWGPRPRICRK